MHVSVLKYSNDKIIVGKLKASNTSNKIDFKDCNSNTYAVYEFQITACIKLHEYSMHYIHLTYIK